MAQNILNYKDGTVYTINIDLSQKDISILRDKAGNVRTWLIKQYGIGLIRDELIVDISEQLKDSEGDPIPVPSNRQNVVFRDQDYFSDVNAYSQNGAIAFAKLFIDVVLKQRLEQTRCYDVDGTFIHPVYFEVVGTDPTTPGGSDGEIDVTILEDGGYVDLEARFRKNEGSWSGWSSITGSANLPGQTEGFYEVEVKSSGTSLLIIPREAVTLTDPVVGP